MFRPHDRKDPKFEEIGFAAEMLFYAVVLVGLEAVVGDNLRRNGGHFSGNPCRTARVLHEGPKGSIALAAKDRSHEDGREGGAFCKAVERQTVNPCPQIGVHPVK